MTKIIFIRHGESEANIAHIINVDPTRAVNLTARGRAQAQAAAERLRAVNPNSTKLSLRGMSYKISLNDYEVVEGAANELPIVPAYGEAGFKVIATIGVFEGIRFVSDMVQHSRVQIAYSFKAKLDVGAMIPAIRIEKTGSYAP